MFFFLSSVKDRLCIRLIETKWVEEVEKLIYAALQKRNKEGQDLTTVKFEDLYQEVCAKARGMCLIMNYWSFVLTPYISPFNFLFVLPI